jgi:hypothetical protein
MWHEPVTLRSAPWKDRITVCPYSFCNRHDAHAFTNPNIEGSKFAHRRP